MADFTANFEAGVNGNTISTGDAGSSTAWNDVYVAGSLAYSNSQIAHGALAAAITGAFSRLTWYMPDPTDHYGRMYVYLTDDTWVFMADKPAFTAAAQIGVFGQLYLQDAVGAQTHGAVTVAKNQWVRIEYHIIHSTTVGQIEAKLFNSADSGTPDEVITSPANRNTAASCAAVRFTTFASSTVYFDDLVANATSYPGPAVGPVLATTLLQSQSTVRRI